MDQGSLLVVGIGFGVVFVGLICLIGIIYLMSFFVRLAKGEYVPAKKKNIPEVIPEHRNASVPFSNRSPLALGSADRREVVAAVSAAVAEYMGESVDGIRIHSIRMTGHAPDLNQRRELIAVISASLAAEMGKDVSGIRIHSIKKV